MPHYHVEITPKLSKPPHRRVEWECDLSLEELGKQFLAPYEYARPIVIRGRTITIDNLHRIRIYQTSWEIGPTSGDPSGWDKQNMADVTKKFISKPAGYKIEASSAAQEGSESFTSIRVFISHSNNDVKVAKLLIDLLRKALNLESSDIRCTSVDGYRITGGASVDDTVRTEVHDTELLIGLITHNSLESAYVMFELGARWGVGMPMIPLLSSGATTDDLGGPLAGRNALDASQIAQLHQLIQDAGRHLSITPDQPSSYSEAIEELAKMSAIPTTSEQLPASDVTSKLSGDAMELLTEACMGPESRSNYIVMVRTSGGTRIQANERDFTEPGNARSEARWEQAIRDLQEYDLIDDRTGKDEVFFVTHRGFQLVDELSQSG